MPQESMNIYLTVTDKASPILASITDKTKALDKETQQLAKSYEALQKANSALSKHKMELEKKLKDVNSEVKEAQKNFKKLGDEVSGDAYQKAQEKQQKLRNEIEKTNKALEENQKIYKENVETIRKSAANKAGNETAVFTELFKGLGVDKQISSLVQQASNFAFTSALGSDMGGMVSGGLSGAISGGLTGAAFGPLGAAIGAAVGGISGLVSGLIEKMEKEDDAFIAYYNGLYNDVKGRSGETIEAGSTLAGGREQDLLVFKRLFGDEQTARDYLDSLVETAGATPLSYSDLVSLTKTMANYGYESEDILDALKAAGNAGTALGLGTGDITALAKALGQINKSAAVTPELLNAFQERDIEAVLLGRKGTVFSEEEQAKLDELGRTDFNGCNGIFSLRWNYAYEPELNRAA